ncbi:hypothetical protein SBA3_3840012 [Candidatus Sulfopaludibacter sp. SbA3]|nr:hypothetical protein SBA3_3840012 [Candidatus Sulfopaludibacter sp. SbA3]
MYSGSIMRDAAKSKMASAAHREVTPTMHANLQTWERCRSLGGGGTRADPAAWRLCATSG